MFPQDSNVTDSNNESNICLTEEAELQLKVPHDFF